MPSTISRNSRLIAIRSLLRFFALLPLPIAHFLGAFMGCLVWLTPNQLRRQTLINLQLCFPGQDRRQRRRMARRSLLELGKTVTELGTLWLGDQQKAEGLIRHVEGAALVDNALRQDRGLIFVAPHLGCWESAGIFGANNYQVTTLYRTPRMHELSSLVRAARTRFGAKYVPANASGTRALYKALGHRKVVGILPDQEPSAGMGTFAPFFGVQAYTMVLLSRLAQKTGAPVIMVYSERLPWGRGYHLHFRSVSEAVHSKDLHTSVTAINQAIEGCIRELPEQYQWSYRRFRSRPNGADSIY